MARARRLGGTLGGAVHRMRSAVDRVAELPNGVANYIAAGTSKHEVLSQALTDTHLPDHLLQLLGPLVEQIGFRLDPERKLIRDLKGNPIYHHRVAAESENGRGARGYIALLYFGSKLLQDPDNASEFMFRVHEFDQRRNGAIGLVVFSDAPRIEAVFKDVVRRQVEDGRLRTAVCVSALDLEDLGHEDADGKARKLRSWLGADQGILPLVRPAAPLSVTDLRDRPAGKRRLEEIERVLVAQVVNAPPTLGAQGYLERLIRNTNWRDTWKVSRTAALRGDPYDDVERLIDWAIAQGTNPLDSRYTVLGSLLEVLMDDVGQEQARILEETILSYNLIQGYTPRDTG